MKTLTAVIPSILLCVGLALPGYAAKGTVSGEPFAGEAMMQSVEFHEAAIQQHQDKAAVLAQKIQQLEHRLDMVKNSYRDPKGFKRQSWTRVLGKWRGELQGLQEHVSWHEEQMAQLKKSE